LKIIVLPKDITDYKALLYVVGLSTITDMSVLFILIASLLQGYRLTRMRDMSRWNVKTFGCSLPKHLLEKLDTTRGDVNRSRYIQRLIEKNMNTIVQTNPQVTRPERFTLPSTKRIGDPIPIGQ
jgi:hypothetical protein